MFLTACRRTTRTLAITILLIGGVFVPGAIAAPGEVLASFPSPGPGPRDLAWDGTHLWLLDDELNTLYKLDPESGQVRAEISAEAFQACALTWADEMLWVSNAETQRLQQLDLELGTVERELDAPGIPRTTSSFQLDGLAWDGTHLWSGCVAGWSSRISQVDPQSGEIQRFIFTKGYPNAVETNGRLLWTATHNRGHRRGLIYQYDYETGQYLTQFDTPGDEPVGLAFDGQHLWCVDRQTLTIYRIALK